MSLNPKAERRGFVSPLLTLLSLGLASALLVSNEAAAMTGSISADYTKGFEPGDPYMGLSLSLGEKLNSSFSLFLNQAVTKNFVIDSETDEWQASDTRIGLSFNGKTDTEGLEYRISPSLSLPVSKSSQRQEVYSKPMLSIGLSFTKGIVSLGVSAYVRDTISPFETAPSENGQGGWVLPDYDYGASHNFTLSFVGFDLGYSVSYVETIFHKQDRRESEANDFRSDLPSQGYDLSLFLSRNLWPGAAISATYMTGSALVQEGYEDYVIFDSAESQYAFGFSQSF